MPAELPWGSRVQWAGARPVAIHDRLGNAVADMRWSDGELQSARLRLPSGGHVDIVANSGEHPLFGPVDAARTEGDEGPPVTFAAVRWSAPTSIPPLDRPGALVPGAGTAILNLLARRAAQVGTVALRYRGPYPTAALFETLQASFRVAGDPDAVAARFCDDVEAHALRGSMREAPVDFTPFPHEWLFVHARVCVQARDELERVYIDGRAYGGDSQSVTRLLDEGDTWVARLEVAGRPWAAIARFDRRAMLLEGPHPIPPVSSPLVGLELPRTIVEVLTEVIRARAPVVMQATLEHLLPTTSLRFDDTAAALALRDAGGIAVHALLGEQLETMDARTQLAWLVAAIEPVARRWAQARLAGHPGE